MRKWVLLAALLLALACPACAGDDVAAAQPVIHSQAEAFGRDDAVAAYAYAAPAIHDMFPRADIFMAMVRRSYALYRHKGFEFGEARVEGGWIAPRVHIIEANGEAWEALYTPEAHPDGTFGITGCSLLKAGQSVDAPHASASRERARSSSAITMTMLSAFQPTPLRNAAA